MKRLVIVNTIVVFCILVLELLPYGAVLRFANPDGASATQTYSYFDITPFGYANFGPFLTGVLTCVLLVTLVVLLFTRAKRGVFVGAFALNCVIIAVSLMPLMFGIEYFTVIGALISILHIASAVMLWVAVWRDKSEKL